MREKRKKKGTFEVESDLDSVGTRAPPRVLDGVEAKGVGITDVEGLDDTVEELQEDLVK